MKFIEIGGILFNSSELLYAVMNTESDFRLIYHFKNDAEYIILYENEEDLLEDYNKIFLYANG